MIFTLKELVAYAQNKHTGITQDNEIFTVGNLAEHIICRIVTAINIDLSEYEFVITTSSINHLLKNHSNQKIESKRQPPQIAIQFSDIEMIPEIL